VDRRSTVLLYLGSALAALAAFLLVEGGVRLSEAASRDRVPRDVPSTIASLTDATIEGREIGNQFLVHNLNLFARYPHPERVDTAYVGTSRTKVLRPAWMGQANAVNGSGNSYNEISYGLLLQAEVVRLRFPNVKRIYVESSLLLRRPGRLIVEPDHRKYLPLLQTLLPLRDQLPGADRFRAELARAEASPRPPNWPPHLVAHRPELRLSRLLPDAAQGARIPVTRDGLFQELDASGERKAPPLAVIPPEQQRPEITIDNVKVQRLRKIPEWAPWDGLFDMVALWGRLHGIEIVLFQPPVRSDLYRFQQQFGLAAHVADLQRVAKQYGIPFVDLDRPELGYMSDWALFSDEDHMETCAGVALLQTALTDGHGQFRERGVLLPAISREEAARLAAPRLRQCAATSESRPQT
jgi:hypothetical protein